MNAVDVRFAGQKIEVRKPSRPLPRAAIGAVFLLGTVVGTLLGILPAAIAIGYMLLSGLSYIMYTIDKAASGRGARRTPENTLHFVDLLGGWPGALIAQQQSRHKTVKASFQSVFRFTVFANLVAVAWLAYSGIVRSLTASLLGE